MCSCSRRPRSSSLRGKGMSIAVARSRWPVQSPRALAGWVCLSSAWPRSSDRALRAVGRPRCLPGRGVGGPGRVGHRRHGAALRDPGCCSGGDGTAVGRAGVVAGPVPPAAPDGATSRRAHGATDLRLPAVMVLAWELVGVLVGGSYWLHYLVALVPGVALLVGVGLQRRPSLGRGFRVSHRRWRRLDDRHDRRHRGPSRARPRAGGHRLPACPCPARRHRRRRVRCAEHSPGCGAHQPLPQPVEPPGSRP